VRTRKIKLFYGQLVATLHSCAVGSNALRFCSSELVQDDVVPCYSWCGAVLLYQNLSEKGGEINGNSSNVKHYTGKNSYNMEMSVIDTASPPKAILSQDTAVSLKDHGKCVFGFGRSD
jgi:hypothetical protein